METKNEATMADTLHRCLMCNKPAFEYEEDKYKCSDEVECNFEWTVTRCG